MLIKEIFGCKNGDIPPPTAVIGICDPGVQSALKMQRALITLLAASVVAVTGCRDTGPPVAVGTLERHRIELRAERQEPILRLAVKEGDRVEAGDPLVLTR